MFVTNSAQKILDFFGISREEAKEACEPAGLIAIPCKLLTDPFASTILTMLKFSVKKED
jgi:hypothetical protein